MARDYDAELEALEAKKKRIQEAKAAHERRHYGPAGKDLIEAFPEVFGMKAKERKAFIQVLRELYDAGQASAGARSNEAPAPSMPVHGTYEPDDEL